MKLISALLLILLLSCSLSKNELNNSADSKDKEIATNLHYSEFETYYLVIADSSKSYQLLYQKMFNLSDKTGLIIDTLNRTYNKEKDNIILPDDDEDELYRGAYFPRRFPSNFLSLEYLGFYDETSKGKMIVLLTGIFEDERSAKKHHKLIKKYEPGAYILKSEVFTGCMH